MDSAVLSPEAVLEIKRLYTQQTEFGRRIWSQARLAKQFGVSETTVYRVLNGFGTFQRAPAPLPDTPEVAARIAASQAKLQALIAADAVAELKGGPNVGTKARLNPQTGQPLADNERWDDFSKSVVVVPY